MHSALSKHEEAIALGWTSTEEHSPDCRDPQDHLGLVQLHEAISFTESPAAGAPSFWTLGGFLSTPESLRFEIRPPSAGYNCDSFGAQPPEISISLPRLNVKLL